MLCRSLPSPLADVVRSLQAKLAVPAPTGTARALQVLSAALGPAAQLVAGAAAPLSAELNTLVLAPPGSTAPLARQVLMAALRAVQDELWALAGEEPTSLLLAGSCPDPAAARARQQPVVLLPAPTFQELPAALAHTFGGSVLTVHDAGSFERFWPDLQADHNGSRWRFFQQLLAGRAKVPKPGVPRRAVLTLLLEVRSDAPAGPDFLTGPSAERASGAW